MMCCDLSTARDVELGMQTDWFDYRVVMHNIMSGQYWLVCQLYNYRLYILINVSIL